MEGFAIIGKLFGYLVHSVEYVLMSRSAGDEFLKSCEYCPICTSLIWNDRDYPGYSVYDYSHGARVGFAPSVNNVQ
jgi:hypothetical protein